MAGRNVSVLVLYNSEGKVLLQHRDKNASRLPGYWAFFGGGIEEGESAESALSREIWEELEYKPIEPRFVWHDRFEYKDDVNELNLFVEEYDNTQPLVQREGDGMAWVAFEETEGMLMIEHDRQALGKVKDYLGSLGLV